MKREFRKKKTPLMIRSQRENLPSDYGLHPILKPIYIKKKKKVGKKKERDVWLKGELKNYVE